MTSIGREPGPVTVEERWEIDVQQWAFVGLSSNEDEAVSLAL
jgi:hypothetical protein